MPYTIRDPIHGFIEIHATELEVINHPAFQRLRRIRQLAMAYLGFPGALHTRFDHSLGTLHVADRLAQALGIRPGDDELQNVRLAALVHDIGHGPFSHVSESVLRSPSQLGKATETLHETVTREVVQRVLVGRVLAPHQGDAVEALLDPLSYGRTVEHDIISGPLDADKLDYLLRDSYFCGVRYGVYDLDRLLETVVSVDDRDAKRSYIGVQEEDLPAVDQYVLARHNLGQVYFHKVRRIADAMLTRSLTLAAEEGNERVARTFKPTAMDEAYLDHYLDADDETMVRWVLEAEGAPSALLMCRLRERRLVKEVFRHPLARCGDAVFREEIQTPDGRRRWELRISNKCSIEEDYLVFAVPQEGKPLRKGAWQDGPEMIPVVCLDGKRRSYDAVSPVFRFGAHRGVDYLSVYLPLFETDEKKKQAERVRQRDRIAELVGLTEEVLVVPTCPHCSQPLPEREAGSCPVCGRSPVADQEGD
jgi:HD superfamily phosphohydrolase